MKKNDYIAIIAVLAVTGILRLHPVPWSGSTR